MEIKKGGNMRKQLINYETLLKVTKAMSMSTRPEEVVQLTVDSVKTSLEIKGCALFLIDMCRLYQGQKEFNAVLMEMHEARAM